MVTKFPEKRSNCICVDSVFRMGNDHYQQVLLQECKYNVKVKQLTTLITVDIKNSSDDYNDLKKRLIREYQKATP